MSDGVWTPNDYSNIATVGAAALCSILMVLFKSRCSEISLFWGLWKCNRNVPENESDEEDANPPQPPQQQNQNQPVP